MFNRKKGKKSSSDGLFEQDVFVAPERNKRRGKPEQPQQTPFPEEGYTDEYDVQPSTAPQRQEQPNYHTQQRVVAKWKKKDLPPVYREEPQEYKEEPLYKKPTRPERKERKQPLYSKEQPVTPPIEEDKAELNQYFEQNKKQSKKLKKQPKQTPKKKPKVNKKAEKRQLEMDLYEGRAFKFRNEIFRSVEEFIEYLQQNYLQIDKIAKEVFENEKFYAWLKEYSYNFDASLVVFEELQQKIEN